MSTTGRRASQYSHSLNALISFLTLLNIWDDSTTLNNVLQTKNRVLSNLLLPHHLALHKRLIVGETSFYISKTFKAFSLVEYVAKIKSYSSLVPTLPHLTVKQSPKK